MIITDVGQIDRCCERELHAGQRRDSCTCVGFYHNRQRTEHRVSELEGHIKIAGRFGAEVGDGHGNRGNTQSASAFHTFDICYSQVERTCCRYVDGIVFGLTIVIGSTCAARVERACGVVYAHDTHAGGSRQCGERNSEVDHTGGSGRKDQVICIQTFIFCEFLILIPVDPGGVIFCPTGCVVQSQVIGGSGHQEGREVGIIIILLAHTCEVGNVA